MNICSDGLSGQHLQLWGWVHFLIQPQRDKQLKTDRKQTINVSIKH